MNYVEKITKYFRQSLIDSERLAPDDKSIKKIIGENQSKIIGGMLNIDNRAWKNGYLNPDVTNKIFHAIEISKHRKTKQQIEEIILMPRVDLLQVEGGRTNSYKKDVLVPLLVFAVINREGRLYPSKDKAPWIPRIWLSPNEGTSGAIGEVADEDEFLTHNPYESVSTWQELIEYSENMLFSITKLSFDEKIHSNYEKTDHAIILIDPPLVGAKDKIRELYEIIMENSDVSTLYKRFISNHEPKLSSIISDKEQDEIAMNHVGQMSGEFALSKNQRNALHHQLKDQVSGSILAVNGPPGTGKTTLLRSVVANMWVMRAVEENEPPVIVAASSNNQAVTNILESFARINEEGVDGSLQGRWIPELDSYGLYCCSTEKANPSNKYFYYGKDNDGKMPSMQTQEYIGKAESYFLSAVSLWQKKDITKLEEAKKVLHGELLNAIGQIRKGLNHYNELKMIEAEICKLYGSLEQLKVEIESILTKLTLLDSEEKSYRQDLDSLYALWENRSWWQKFFHWFPTVRKINVRANKRYFNNLSMSLDNYTDTYAEQFYEQKIEMILEQKMTQKNSYDHLSMTYDKWKYLNSSLEEWLQKSPLEQVHDTITKEIVEEVCDRVWRFKAFKLATHYWECRWLIETRQFVEKNDDDKKSPRKQIRKWKRFAKLTPCFVSTFYMIPSFFVAGEYKDGTWKDLPLFEEIDLLIVDEAGQALPEIAAGSFALSKSALIVGDTDQIEPVWNIPASIDRANLKQFELMTSEDDYDRYIDSGLTASSGNVMRVAQRQSIYHQYLPLQRGLYLTEHRRCFNPIIEYCNKLVYKGVLEPLRGSAHDLLPWRPMEFIHSPGDSRQVGSSRINTSQVDMILAWIQSNRQIIVKYVRTVDPTMRELSEVNILENSIGIITPFAKQASEIKSRLKNIGLPSLTTGTVHSLQGDERYFVLFSSVYGGNDKGASKFYDRGSNMLNVAVSRAKDSFLVFGDEEIFGMDSPGLPSGILRQHIDK